MTFEESICLEMQVALLGEVPPNLRMVLVSISPKRIQMDCYFDGQPSEDDMESMSCVETELLASLPHDVEVLTNVERLDFPHPLPQRLHCVYRRREYPSP